MGGAAPAATVAPTLEQCQDLLAAIERLDPDATGAALDASVRGHGLALTLDQVLLPAMREVGERWSRGQCDVAQEHLASSTVLAWLARRAGEAPDPTDARPVVLSCGPQDQHTISLDAFEVLVREARIDCRNLGALTSARSLRLAVERCSARAVVLVSQLPRNRAAAASALRGISGSGAQIFYAGAAFRSSASRQKLPGQYLGGNFAHAITNLSAALADT